MYLISSFIAILDVALSLLFVFLLIISFFVDERSTTLQRYVDPSFGSVIKAISSFSFAFGNGSVLPTVLTDMKDRRMFTQALATGLMSKCDEKYSLFFFLFVTIEACRTQLSRNHCIF